MLKTRFTELLGIDHPIILAAMGSATSASFAAAASNAGALGSIGSLNRTTEAVLRDLKAIRDLTSGPFAVNHIPVSLDQEAFAATLALRPAVMSFALADLGDLAKRAKDAGALVMIQVTTVAQAEAGAERGADLIVAQGGEAGGYGGDIGTMVLVPQVVDAVAPIPVVAAGGIYDGRGVAAALMLGAVAVNLGTRFLASTEAPIDEGWQQAILNARSEDAIKADALNAINPLPGTAGYGTVLRALRSPFLEQWNADLEGATAQRDQLRAAIAASAQEGRRNETIAGAGQTAGGIREVRPVAQIIASLVEEAEAALRAAAGCRA
jgi:nitronate monooxygenase/enoyl-[acyl-carrier protein] reductase II